MRGGGDEKRTSPRAVEAIGVASPSARPPPADVARPGNDAVFRGSPDAPVTVTVFGDVQCPFTRSAVMALLDVQATYGRERVRLAWRNYPLSFHRRARRAAEAIAGVDMLSGGEAARHVLAATLDPAADLGDDGLAALAVRAGAPADTYESLSTEGSTETAGASTPTSRPRRRSASRREDAWRRSVTVTVARARA